MHKYFNFTKIFEAEQTGEPLNPEEVGTPSAPTAQETQKTDSVGDAPITLDIDALVETHILDALFTKSELEQLERDGTLLKPDAKFINKDTGLDAKQVSIKIVVSDLQSSGSQDDPNAVTFVISEKQLNDMKEGMKRGIYQSALFSTKATKQIPVRFNIDQSIDAQPTETTVVAPSDEQMKAGTVPPPPVEGSVGSNESTGIMSFDQFINESKKNKWIADVVKDMDKGALRKEMKLGKDEEMNLTDIAKSEQKLAKKDKDKKKKGLQLGTKDAKTHKRNVLAKNLIRASRGK